jgi:hypothetical protein
LAQLGAAGIYLAWNLKRQFGLSQRCERCGETQKLRVKYFF